MSGEEFDGFSEGEWENSGEISWNEYDWQRFLKSNDAESARFLELYGRFRHRPDHLDQVAHLMGWDAEDWAPGDDEDVDESADLADGEFDPYTIHRHPVYIVTHGLYRLCFSRWEMFAAQNRPSLDPVFAVRFCSVLNNGELNAMMAVAALDMGDFNLAVCHLKNSLTSLNQTMRLLQRVEVGNHRLTIALQNEILPVLFDLREIWLRVMKDCREEERRHQDRD